MKWIANFHRGHDMTRPTNQQRAMMGGVLGVLAMCLGVAHAQDAPKEPAPRKNACEHWSSATFADGRSATTQERASIENSDSNRERSRHLLRDHSLSRRVSGMQVGTGSRPLHQRPLGGPNSRSLDSRRTTTRQIVLAGKREGYHQANPEDTTGVSAPDVGSLIHEAVGVKALSMHHDISTVTVEEVVILSLAESPRFQ